MENRVQHASRTLPVAVAAVALGLCAASSVHGRIVAEGPLPTLSDSEGFLVVVVDTTSRIRSLRLKREGRGRGRAELKDLPRGRSLHVLRLPAGDYRWHRVEADRTVSFGVVTLELDFGTFRWDIGRSPNSVTIPVQAGALNYAGDLHLTTRNGMLFLDSPNRSEQALSMLRVRHGQQPGSLPLRWRGRMPDPYPDWRPATLAPDTETLADRCPELDTLPAGVPKAGDLFRSGEVMSLQMNPRSDLLLETSYRDGRYEANVIDPAIGDLVRLYEGEVSIADAEWLGPRRIGLHLSASTGAHGVHVFTLAEGRLHGRGVTHMVMPVDGYILDPLPADPDSMLFTVLRPGHSDPLQVFRVDLSRRSLSASQFQPLRRLNRGSGSEVAWLGDGSGQLRAALLRNDDGDVLAIRESESGDFVPIASLGIDNYVSLQAVEADGRVLLLTNMDREQVDLVRLDPRRPAEPETVFSVPGVDLAGVARTSGGRIVGARYYQSGVLLAKYFEPDVQRWQQQVNAAFPNRAAHMVDVDLAARRAVVVVTDDITPPSYYWLDIDAARAEKIADGMPWLAGQRFVRRHVTTVAAADGHPIQVLTAIPAGDGPHPLLVMPHGGPFYVQDVLEFDSDIQYWASRGFAVMQINFRGSYGFGVRHLVGGFAGFGRQIEDDIEAALAAMLEQRPELDRERICAIGSSYGGYSGLVLALRNPDLIRCVVAVAAPTDLPLLFTSSDWNRKPGTRDAMLRLVGDPADPALQSLSPLYRASDLTVPVLLVHGARDRRVDYEHSVRLATMLRHLGKPHRLIRIDEMSHGPDTVGQHICINGVAEQFIRKQLSAEP